MSKLAQSKSSRKQARADIAAWFAAAGISVGVVAFFIALVLIVWGALGAATAALVWAGFAWLAPQMGLTFLHIWLPATCAVGVAALWSGAFRKS